MKRGRRPVPDQLKKLHGTFRADRACKGPDTPDGPLIPDDVLLRSKYGRVYWDHYITTAPPGLLKPVDAPFLSIVCACLGMAREAMDEIKAAGGLNPYDKRLRLLGRLYDQQNLIALKWLRELALAPSSPRDLG